MEGLNVGRICVIIQDVAALLWRTHKISEVEPHGRWDHGGMRRKEIV